MTIWKFPADGPILVPQGARWLCAQYLGGALFAWAVVDPHAPSESWIVRDYPTGGSAPDTDAVYIGTVQQPPFVWHAFAERCEP